MCQMLYVPITTYIILNDVYGATSFVRLVAGGIAADKYNNMYKRTTVVLTLNPPAMFTLIIFRDLLVKSLYCIL